MSIMQDIMYHITDIVTKAAVGITAVINSFSRLLLNLTIRIIPRVYQMHANAYTVYTQYIHAYSSRV